MNFYIPTSTSKYIINLQFQINCASSDSQCSVSIIRGTTLNSSLSTYINLANNKLFTTTPIEFTGQSGLSTMATSIVNTVLNTQNCSNIFGGEYINLVWVDTPVRRQEMVGITVLFVYHKIRQYFLKYNYSLHKYQCN